MEGPPGSDLGLSKRNAASAEFIPRRRPPRVSFTAILSELDSCRYRNSQSLHDDLHGHLLITNHSAGIGAAIE